MIEQAFFSGMSTINGLQLPLSEHYEETTASIVHVNEPHCLCCVVCTQ